jgi:hypothetical protein
MIRVLSLSLALGALTAAAARGATAHPFHYHWKDIGGNCVSDCNNDVYRCPCIHVNMPR